jgi:hypothetical protein
LPSIVCSWRVICDPAAGALGVSGMKAGFHLMT